MAMSINRLYEELGKAVVDLEAIVRPAQLMYEKAPQGDGMGPPPQISDELRDEVANAKEAHRAGTLRVSVLKEAIKLARDEAMDPLQAKIVAAENVITAKEQSRAATAAIGQAIHNSVNICVGKLLSRTTV